VDVINILEHIQNRAFKLRGVQGMCFSGSITEVRILLDGLGYACADPIKGIEFKTNGL